MKIDRQAVFSKFGGKCAYCGCELLKGWHVDHKEPIRRNRRYDQQLSRWVKDGEPEHPERENFDNYMPSCQSCNINKHSDTLEDFRKNIVGYMKHLNELNTQYKVAKRYGLVQQIDKPIVFYFETLNPINHANGI